MEKIITAEDAAGMIEDGKTLAVGGFVGFGTPEELLVGLQNHFSRTGSPRELTAFHVAGIGDGEERGGNRLGEEGLLKRIICGHVGLAPKIGSLISKNKIEAFLVPQGVASHLLRSIAGGKPGIISHVGLKTYADPRNEGCRVNEAAQKSGYTVVELMQRDGRDYLFYRAFPIDYCFIKGTVADEAGNVSLAKEAVTTDQYEMALATHNCGGRVFVQVERVVKGGSLKAREVEIPSFLTDYIVIAKPENNYQGFGSPNYCPEFSGEWAVPMAKAESMVLSPRKVCGRIGARFLKKGALVNLGIGIPETVGAVAGEEGIADQIILSLESGVLGGIPTGGLGMGASVNPVAIMKQPEIFDLYDGGGLDMAFLGAAQIDKRGNVNVSKFAGRIVGPGGFINITQNAKELFFVGTFTAGKAKEEISDGKLHIIEDGKGIKFVDQVEQVTFSGEYANENGQTVYFLTERAVFKLVDGALHLIEIAPGVDLEKDVLAKMEFRPCIDVPLKVMDEKIFRTERMGLEID